MIMTNEEIYRDYKLSKRKQRQIHILADINRCSLGQIKQIIQKYEEMLNARKEQL